MFSKFNIKSTNLIILIILVALMIISILMFKVKDIRKTQVQTFASHTSLQVELGKLQAELEKAMPYIARMSAELQPSTPETVALQNLVNVLKVYTVYDQNGIIKHIRHGRPMDGGYVVPEIAFNTAQALIGYGIADDISFEEQFSDLYNKPSYGFDCGAENVKVKNKLCTFIKECISSDASIYANQKSSNEVSSFSQQLQKLGLEGKKLFIKMDIEGTEYEAFEDIYKHASNITGIALEIHFVSLEQMLKATKLISRLGNDFFLTHVHGNNCVPYTFVTKQSNGIITKVLELTFINKSLVSKFQISNNQSHPLPIDMPNCPNKEETKFEILLNN